MDLSLDGLRVHGSTGGPALDPAGPLVMFLHGAGMDHSVWSLQTRWFAYHGFAALALDLPGHGRSEGVPLATIEAMADHVARVVAALGGGPACLVGHSMGSLVALCAAARHPDRVRALALIGTALVMPVGAELRAAAAANNPDAVTMVNLWGHGSRAGMGSADMPGLWMAGAGQRLLERATPGVLSVDLLACHAWQDGAACAALAKQPTMILQGSRDMMTPLKGARALAAALPNANLRVFEGAGHMLMVEEGAGVLAALADHFGPLAKAA